MKANYKICPFCANEIKEWAIKCQYCESFLDWRDSNKKNTKKKNISNIIIKVLFTLFLISFIILLVGWIDARIHNIDDWYPAYTKIYLYDYFLYFFSALSLSIIYARKRSKESLIMLWINIFLLIAWYLIMLIVWDDCHYVWDKYYCYNFWWYSFWYMIFLMTIPILWTSLIIYLLRLIWWKKWN